MKPSGQDPRLPGPGTPRRRSGDEPAFPLERGQLVAELSRPVPRAILTTRAVAGLWALRVLAILVSVMVIWTFIDQLR